MKNVLAASQVQSDKKLVNHSTRKHLVQKLVDSNIPPNEIAQITGHKNINSLNNYSAISDKRQQQISVVLSGGKETSTCTHSGWDYSNGDRSNPAKVQELRPFFYQCQVGTVNIFTNSNKTAASLSRNSLTDGELLWVTVTRANKKFKSCVNVHFMMLNSLVFYMYFLCLF